MIATLSQALATWNSYYGNHQALSVTIRYLHLAALLVGGGIDAVLFANVRALDEFARLIDTDDLPKVLAGVTVLCGDSESAQVAHEYGLSASEVTPETRSAGAIAKLLKAST